jgi:hypothetical protein
VHQRRHEVPEGLAGAGAGLDEQMRSLVHRGVDGLRHLHLPGPGLSGDPGHGSFQQFPHINTHRHTLARATDRFRPGGLGCG